MTTTADIIAAHDQYLSPNYGRYPVAMVQGRGTQITDAEGNSYLDLFAGFGGPLLGHCHPELVAALTRQANTLWFAGNLFHTEPQTQLATAIARHGFGGQSFFCHSGADANEAAIKLARLHGREQPGPAGPRFKIISATQSFHGRTFATMAATGQPKVGQLFEPLPPGFTHVPYNDINAIERAIDEQTAAVLLEPIQGEGGINVPDDHYLPAVRKLCDEHNLLLIVDEVWTGCGRTGRYFAHQHYGITPDVMTLAKGVGGGLPVGVCCARPEVAALFDHRQHGGAVHATTLGGNCLAMAVAATIFQVIERDKLVEHAATLGQQAIERLTAFAADLPAIRQVRGKGLFIGIELDPSATGAWFKNAGEVVNRCRENHVLINAAQNNVLRLAPALTIEPEQLNQGLTILEQVIDG